MSQVHEKYLAGYWSKLTLPPRINLTTGPTLVSNPTASDYVLRDNYNSTLVFSTTNTSRFDAFDKTGVVLEPKKFVCEWCKNEFIGIPLGYPGHHEEKTIISMEDGRHVNNYVHVFWTQGEYHSYECAMGAVMELQGRLSRVDYNQAFEMLCAMFAIQHPGEHLRAAPDYRLLREHGGNVDKSADLPYHLYQPTSRMITAPLKIEYFRNLYPNVVDFYRPNSRINSCTPTAATGTQMTDA